jgi:hypothetical protein
MRLQRVAGKDAECLGKLAVASERTAWFGLSIEKVDLNRMACRKQSTSTRRAKISQITRNSCRKTPEYQTTWNIVV